MNNQIKNLQKLQSWMQEEIIVSTGTYESRSSIHFSSSPNQIKEILTSSQDLSAEELLSIYKQSYVARILECLRSQFPRLCHFLQEEVFDLFALEYLKLYPSKSYSLNNIDKNFVNYLDESRKDKNIDQSWSNFIVELATLDSIFNSVYNSSGSEEYDRFISYEIMQRTTSEVLELSFELVKPIHFIEFKYPVHKFIYYPDNIDLLNIDRNEKNYIIVSRHRYICQILNVTKPQFIILKEINNGLRVGSAVKKTAEVAELSEEELLEQVRVWLFLWADNNLLISQL